MGIKGENCFASNAGGSQIDSWSLNMIVVLPNETGNYLEWVFLMHSQALAIAFNFSLRQAWCYWYSLNVFSVHEK